MFLSLEIQAFMERDHILSFIIFKGNRMKDIVLDRQVKRCRTYKLDRHDNRAYGYIAYIETMTLLCNSVMSTAPW